MYKDIVGQGLKDAVSQVTDAVLEGYELFGNVVTRGHVLGPKSRMIVFFVDYDGKTAHAMGIFSLFNVVQELTKAGVKQFNVVPASIYKDRLELTEFSIKMHVPEQVEEEIVEEAPEVATEQAPEEETEDTPDDDITEEDSPLEDATEAPEATKDEPPYSEDYVRSLRDKDKLVEYAETFGIQLDKRKKLAKLKNDFFDKANDLYYGGNNE